MIPQEKLNSHIEKGTIQIAPLAFMRGRTLDNAFVILDEGQNTTHAQMKMFLTRMGRNAKFMVTGRSRTDRPAPKGDLRTERSPFDPKRNTRYQYYYPGRKRCDPSFIGQKSH